MEIVLLVFSVVFCWEMMLLMSSVIILFVCFCCFCVVGWNVFGRICDSEVCVFVSTLIIVLMNGGSVLFFM